jgi:uncharacterized protein (DUF302 family)
MQPIELTETTIGAYAITRRVDGAVPDVVERVTAALREEGFGILTTIDVQATLKAKLDQDVAPYVILGACNPQLASRGLELEPDLGVLLPCNVVVREAAGGVVVAAMEPLAALALAGSEALTPLATEARERIERAVRSL